MGDVVVMDCPCGYSRRLFVGCGMRGQCHLAVVCPQGHWVFKHDARDEDMPEHCPECGEAMGAFLPPGPSFVNTAAGKPQPEWPPRNLPLLVCPQCGRQTLARMWAGLWD